MARRSTTVSANPAGSSIHARNICGKEGHQAAQCTTGTVNWAAKFGPAWTSDLDAVKKEPDYKDIAAQAKAFAAKRLAEEEKPRKAEGLDVDEDSDKEADHDDEGKAAKDGRRTPGTTTATAMRTAQIRSAPGTTMTPTKATTRKRPPRPRRRLPAPASDWKVFYHTSGRPYYHNAKTESPSGRLRPREKTLLVDWEMKNIHSQTKPSSISEI